MRDARRKMERALASGAAAEKFAAMVHALCGPHDVLDHSDAHLAPAPCIGEVEAPIDGFISALSIRALWASLWSCSGGGRSVPRPPSIPRSDRAISPESVTRLGGIARSAVFTRAAKQTQKRHRLWFSRATASAINRPNAARRSSIG